MKFTKIEKVDSTHLLIVSYYFHYISSFMLEVLASTTAYLNTQTQTYEINRIRIGKQDTKLPLFIKSGIFTEKIQQKLQTNY